MRTTHIAKYGWFTSSPANIVRSVDIGVGLVAAGTAPKLALARAWNLRSGMALASGIAGNVGHRQVSPQKVGRLDRRTGGRIYGAVQVEPALTVDQVGLPFYAVEPVFLTLPACQRDEDAALRQSVTWRAAGARRAGNLFLCRLKATVSEVPVL